VEIPKIPLLELLDYIGKKIEIIPFFGTMGVDTMKNPELWGRRRTKMIINY
jgi:hypothetical protein